MNAQSLDLWPGHAFNAVVERERCANGKLGSDGRGTRIVQSYRTLSGCDAELAGTIIRGRLGIENGLHNLLNLTVNEHWSRVRKVPAAVSLP